MIGVVVQSSQLWRTDRNLGFDCQAEPKQVPVEPPRFRGREEQLLLKFIQYATTLKLRIFTYSIIHLSWTTEKNSDCFLSIPVLSYKVPVFPSYKFVCPPGVRVFFRQATFARVIVNKCNASTVFRSGLLHTA